MNDKKKVTINTIFYFVYQAILFVAPLIIMPYLTRVLSETSLGQYTFSYSVAYYFVLGANLGISTYGQREIASNRNDKDKLSRKFWSLFYVHSISSLLSLIAYVFFFIFSKQVSIYVFILPYVISALFDVTWLFYGLENFKIVTLINMATTVLKGILIFLLVKNDSHLWVYQLVAFSSMFLSQFIVFIFALKTVGLPKKVTVKECTRHLKPIMYFALAVIALSLYTYVDKILLGVMVHDAKKSVAYYECADKIVAVPRMLITVLGTVLYPKMCALTSESDTEGVGEFTIFSIDWTTFLSIGSIFGLFAVAIPLATLYYGESYYTSGVCMIMMAPLILVISMGSICRTQYILPQKKDHIFLIAISMNAIINLALNALLIPFLGIYGVIIASLISETVALIFQLLYCRKFFPFNYSFKVLLIHILAGFVMFAFLFFGQRFIVIDGWVKLLLFVAVGVGSYVLILFILSKIIGYQNLIQKLFVKK